MFDKVICPFYSVNYCIFKDHCCKEHPKEDCCNSSCPKNGCLKRHRKQCKYGDFCRRYNKDQSCEFRHFHDSKEVDNMLADNEEFDDAINEREYVIVKNIIINEEQLKKFKSI